MTDLLIENARVVDGTGAPWFRGAVAVEDGRIEAIRRESSPDVDPVATVDAAEKVVCPGFIDTHSHSDLELFEDPTLAPKIRQGITTEILGQDGFSMAPMYRDGGADQWAKQLGALAGRADVEWTWGSVADYLDAVEENGVAPNVALLVGHGAVRFDVLGMADRAPTDAELDEMGELVTEALEDGAVGFSTGLIYTPCTYADTREIRELAARLGPYGRPFVAHVRSEGRWIWEALDEFVDVGAAEDVPLHLSHFKVAGPMQHGKAGRATELVEAARERGVDLTAEQYPYTAGSTMLSAVLPPWVHAEGPDGTLEHLTDETARDRIRRDVEEWRIDGWENIGKLAGWENVVIANVETAANEHVEGMDVAAIAAERDVEPVDAICDLLVEEDLGVSMTIHMLEESDVREILSYERVCVGSDGLFGGKPHPRVYGTYPRILGHYVREENHLSLEEAVRKMTSLPARAMGLDRKGVLRPGMDADLVVFDPVTVESRATFENPRRHPKGIDHVLVNGEFVVRDAETTGNLAGRAVRR
ncbi:amidohydrolase family protein [Halorubrum rubrum]|uniref:Amidohydrolase family protein n=1 Tax=Halorubrum rubrum TaxID=1126240 RepID=A0ABD5QX35_9EURY|nr:D-aminoacylase [Halorubrum rubrum]